MLCGPKLPTDVIIRADLMHQITYYRRFNWIRVFIGFWNSLDKIVTNNKTQFDMSHSYIYSCSQANMVPGFIKSAVIICCVGLTLVILIYLVSSIFIISLSSA